MTDSIYTISNTVRRIIRDDSYADHLFYELLPEDGPLPVKSGVGFDELSFIPTNPNYLQYLIAAKDLIQARAKSNWYCENLIMLVTLEKSGSTFVEILLRNYLSATKNPNAYYFPNFGCAGPVSYAGLSQLTPLGLLSLPEGGVWRGCFLPTKKHIRFIRLLKCKSVILLRHPLDRMIANICMRYKSLSCENTLSLNDVLKINIIGQWDVDNAFWKNQYHPSLYESLEWMSGWITQSNKLNSMIIKFEDIILNYDQTAPEIFKTLFGTDVDDITLKECKSFLTRTNKGGDLQASANNPNHAYPRGYTGHSGVWRNYLTPELIDLSNTIIDNFLATCPNRDKILELYPDIIINKLALK